MKKTIVFALLVALMMSIALPVTVAADSKEAEVNDLLPAVTEVTNVTLVTGAQEDALNDDQKAALESAQEELNGKVPEGYSPKYIFHCLKEDPETTATAEFEMTGDVIFWQFVDGKWNALDSTQTDNGLTVTGIQDAPMAILVKTAEQ